MKNGRKKSAFCNPKNSYQFQSAKLTADLPPSTILLIVPVLESLTQCCYLSVWGARDQDNCFEKSKKQSVPRSHFMLHNFSEDSFSQ
jgi:hypothetical protein